MPAISALAGLKVDESNGAVLDAQGQPIAGLFSAGRTAIGVASHLYISGLSLADCVFSGRRAGLAASCGSGLVRDAGGAVSIDERSDAIASKPAPTETTKVTP